MSYASECLARGRKMWVDTLRGLRERRVQRWFLVLPSAFLGGIFVLIFSFPWNIVIDDSGATLFFIAWYSFAIGGAIAIPRYKVIVTILIALCGTMLTYPWPWIAPDHDPDAPMPYAVWGGAIAGGVVAVVLVCLRLRPRWLLILPSYFVGGGLFFWLGMFSGVFVPIIGQAGMIISEFGISFLGAIAFTVLMAPVHKKAIAVGAFLSAVAFGCYAYWEN